MSLTRKTLKDHFEEPARIQVTLVIRDPGCFHGSPAGSVGHHTYYQVINMIYIFMDQPNDEDDHCYYNLQMSLVSKTTWVKSLYSITQFSYTTYNQNIHTCL